MALKESVDIDFIDVSLAIEITLVANENDDVLLIAVLREVAEPQVQVRERLIVRNVEDEKGSYSFSVVCLVHCPKPFHSSCVPYLNLLVLRILRPVGAVSGPGRWGYAVIKGIVHDTVNQRCLADCLVSNDNNSWAAHADVMGL